MTALVEVKGLDKAFGGVHAVEGVSFSVEAGQVYSVIGPNGAGKTTLISTICGINQPTSGTVTVGGYDTVRDYRETRSLIGLVPQELTTDSFETPWVTVSFSRGLFNKPKDPAYIESVLKDVALWEKKDNKIITLSGGMKRRLLIAKALSHEPRILFLDEPTAGVDVELRRDMWRLVHRLRENGVTVILTTHYIEEAEEMADRVAVIANGEITLVDEKQALMQKLGKKQLILDLSQPLEALPESLPDFDLKLSEDNLQLIYTFESQGERTGITRLMEALRDEGIQFNDLRTAQSSLEEIFVQLVEEA